MLGGYRDSSGGGRASGGTTGFGQPAIPAFAIGAVERLIGSAGVIGSSKIFARLKVGDPVFRGDVIETAASGQVCIRFIDGTLVSLSNSARMVLKEFPGDGNLPAALFDITRGDFSFVAGELAKTGNIKIDTPFASIRGRWRAGGIGTLSLVSLFLAVMDKVQAAPPDAAHWDDEQIPVDYKDEPHGSFEVITKEATPRRIYVDDPGVTWAFRLNSASELSVNQIANSPARMEQLHAIQQNVLHTFSVGLQAMQGPTTNGQNGSTTNPNFEILPGNARPINFSQPDNDSSSQSSTSLQVTKSSGAALKANGATATALDSAPTPPTPPAPDSLFVPPAPPPAPPVPNTLVVPVITAVAPAQNNASSINIAGTAEANDSVTLSNKGNVVGTTTADSGGHWSINGIPLSDGADYSFTATATDAANNTSGPSNALNFHNDQSAPSAPVITTTAPAQNNASSINLAGTAEANNSVTVSNNGTIVGTTSADSSGHWSINGIVLNTGADYSFAATATDAANNTSGPSNALNFHDDQSGPSAIATVTALSADTGASNSDFITSVAAQTVSGTFTGTLAAGEKIQVSADGGATWVDATTGPGTSWSASGVTLAANSR